MNDCQFKVDLTARQISRHDKVDWKYYLGDSVLVIKQSGEKEAVLCFGSCDGNIVTAGGD